LDCTFWLTFKLKIDPGMRSILLQHLTILRALNTVLYNKKYTFCQTRHFIQEAYIGCRDSDLILFHIYGRNSIGKMQVNFRYCDTACMLC